MFQPQLGPIQVVINLIIFLSIRFSQIVFYCDNFNNLGVLCCLKQFFFKFSDLFSNSDHICGMFVKKFITLVKSETAF